MEMPVQIKRGVALLCISVLVDAALFLAHILLGFLIWLRSMQIANLVIPVAPIVMRIFLIAMIWNGKNWARIVFGLLTLVGVAAIPFMPFATRGYWLLVLSLLCQVAGLALLVIQPAADWFKKAAPAND